MKKSQGISLISLVITIVVIIILVGVSIYNGLKDNLDEAGNTMNYNEIFEVSEAVAQRALFNRLNSETYVLVGESGEFEHVMESKSGDEIKKIYTTEEGWYRINEDNSTDLNLDKVRREYLVNYDTNEVISIDPIIYEGEKYYTTSDLQDAINGGESVVSPNRYDNEKGVNKPFVVEGMIPVKRVGDKWEITNVDDVDWYDYAATTSDANGAKGNLWANVALLDEIEVEGMSNEEVRKAPLRELEGKRLTKEGSMYVWIPRFSRGVVGSEMMIVYSRLTDDYFKNPDDGANVIKAFQENGVELTGIWVGKYDTGYIEL